MKNLLLTYSIMLSCIYSISASNNPTSSVFTLLANETSFVIDLETFEEGEVHYVTLEDESGEIIFTDYIERNKQRIKYVLDYLPADIYTVKLKGDNFIENYRIKINEDFASLVDVRRYITPIIRSQANKIIVENKNDSPANISLTIYSNDEIIYTFSENFEESYQKVFNLEQLAIGNYKIMVSNDQFTKEISISLK